MLFSFFLSEHIGIINTQPTPPHTFTGKHSTQLEDLFALFEVCGSVVLCSVQVLAHWDLEASLNYELTESASQLFAANQAVASTLLSIPTYY